MIVLHANGQTCNKFFTYLSYLGDSFESGEKIIVLSPDPTIKDYPNLLNSEIFKFPFYFERVAGVMGYKNYIKLLYLLFGNKYSLKILSLFFKVIPGVRFIIAPTGSHKSANHHKNTDEIKRLFTPNQIILSEVKSEFETIRKKYDIICGVHFRYGDYKTWEGGKYFYSEQQYYALMLKVKKLFPGKSVSFFISSNEYIDFSVFKNCKCFSLSQSTVSKDLYGLSCSDYIIGPPSTFSGWASYYGNTPLYFIESPKPNFDLESFKHILKIWN